MTILIVILLGIIQGLTEFLPISSSAHLVFFQKIFKFQPAGIFIEVMLHFGTLLSLVVFFWKDIIDTLRNFHVVVMIVISTLTTVIIVLPIKNYIENLFDSPDAAIFSSAFLLLTGAILYFAERFSKSTKKVNEINIKNAIIIGVFQAIAVLPGISRSGATISAGMFSGLERIAATKFAFLIAIPAILCATIAELKDAGVVFSIIEPITCIVGILVAFVSGLIALYFVLKFAQSAKLHFFSYYCWIVGIITLIFL